MSEKRLDCRNLACPHPVLKTKELLDEGEVEQITVLVDNQAAQENVSRLLERSGFKVMSWLEGSDYAVSGFRVTLPLFETPKEEPERDIAKVRPEPEERKILILLGANCLGRGDEDLGRKLIANFLATLKEMGRELWCLVLVNSAVQLAVAGSQVLASLQELEQAGVELLVCGTCLNHFQLLEQKQAGATTNMLDIISHMRVADQVITLT